MVRLKKLSRRAFLRAALMGSAAVAASCYPDDMARPPAVEHTPTPFRSLPSPQAPEGQASAPVTGGETGTGAADTLSLDDFLAFSSLLTGVDDLDPAVGQVYLNALQAGGGSSPSVAEAFSLASSGSQGADLESLNESGYFDQEGIGSLTSQIIEMWYTGMYEQDGEMHVATFVDALAWKVLHFTKPPTICADFGFWAEEPLVEISPNIQYTPAPMPEGEGGG